MTYQELKNLRFLKNEIQYLEQKIKEMQREMGSLCSPSLSGMPSARSRLSQPERETEAIEKLKLLYSERKSAYLAECVRAEKYIASVDDSCTRQILRMRFVDGCSWVKIAMSIGGKNTPDGVRMAAIRYINKHP